MPILSIVQSFKSVTEKIKCYGRASKFACSHRKVKSSLTGMWLSISMSAGYPNAHQKPCTYGLCLIYHFTTQSSLTWNCARYYMFDVRMISWLSPFSDNRTPPLVNTHISDWSTRVWPHINSVFFVTSHTGLWALMQEETYLRILSRSKYVFIMLLLLQASFVMLDTGC